MRASRYRWAVDRNDTSNALIADLVMRIPNEHQTLCIMQHLDQMNKLVPLCPGVRYMHAQQNQADLHATNKRELAAVNAKERKVIYDAMNRGEIRKIMSTYVYKQGVNFPQLSIVINAGGGGSDIVARQIPGRESRSIDGKDTAYLIDFWHDWDTAVSKYVDKRTGRETQRQVAGPVLKDDRSREKCYTELGFNQVWIDSIDELPFLKKQQEKPDGKC